MYRSGVKPSSGRMEKLMAELDRIARFAGVEQVKLLDGWNAALS